jgi:hypothetical protein
MGGPNCAIVAKCFLKNVPTRNWGDETAVVVHGEITFWLKKVEIMNTEMRIFSGKGKKGY